MDAQSTLTKGVEAEAWADQLDYAGSEAGDLVASFVMTLALAAEDLLAREARIPAA
jgi:hypothetical protein